MKFMQRALVGGMVFLFFIPGISPAYVIDGGKNAAASLNAGEAGRTAFIHDLSRLSGAEPLAHFSMDAWAGAPALPSRADGWVSGYTIGSVGNRAWTISKSRSESRILLFLGVGFMAMGLAVKMTGKKDARAPRHPRTLPHQVTSFTGSPMRVE